ncbi:MAG: hypothetical protein RL544_1480, partial [Bacteroidota bacterium]
IYVYMIHNIKKMQTNPNTHNVTSWESYLSDLEFE